MRGHRSVGGDLSLNFPLFIATVGVGTAIIVYVILITPPPLRMHGLV